jgi:hypothetical protein
MPTKVQYTKVIEKSPGFLVEMTVADDADVVAAAEFVQFRVALDTSDRYPRLAELQRVALLRARDLLNAEIQRLQAAAGRNP